MSYRRVRTLGMMPPSPFNMPTTTLHAAINPYTMRSQPPGTLFAPYGWGPGFAIGMPARYSHHIDYVREPLPRGTYDTLTGVHGHVAGGDGLGGLAAIAPILAVL